MAYLLWPTCCGLLAVACLLWPASWSPLAGVRLLVSACCGLPTTARLLWPACYALLAVACLLWPASWSPLATF